MSQKLSISLLVASLITGIGSLTTTIVINTKEKSETENQNIVKNGENGLTPYIGQNGNWWIGEVDTNVLAEGKNGNNGNNGVNGLTPYIGENGNWFIGELDTNVSAQGLKGDNGSNGINGTNGTTPHIGENGNWFIGEVDTNVSAQGPKGDNGSNGINGNSGTTPHIGENGNWFIGEVDTNVHAQGPQGSTGLGGQNGTNGITPHIGENGNWFIGELDTNVSAQGPKGEKGEINTVTVVDSFINDRGDLILTFSNGQIINCGHIVDKKIKNIIYLIGDGMGFNSVKAGELYSNSEFSFKNWNKFCCNTNSLNSSNFAANETTDSAAAGTALATGTLTTNGKIGKDKNGNNLETIFDVADRCDKSIGIVTTDYLNGATPAAFSAHANDRNDNLDIIESQSQSEVDLFIGNYIDLYKDNKGMFTDNDFTYSTELNDALLTENKLIINNSGMNPYEGTNSLLDSTKFAIDYLNKDKDGFALMIEQAYIDKNAHDNNFEGMAKASSEFGKTVEYILNRFKDQDDTLIIVTADHETGGLNLSLDNIYKNSFTKGDVTFSYEFTSASHTKSFVPLYINKDIFDFDLLDDDAEYPLIKNSEIASVIKNILNK